MRPTLNKENFWNGIEAKYPKAMAYFKSWVNQYKAENEWEDLFGGLNGLKLIKGQWHKRVIPKFHDLPMAMQFGIFTEYIYHCSEVFELDIVLKGIEPDIESSLRRSVENISKAVERIV